jgi:hypothetical protein
MKHGSCGISFWSIYGQCYCWCKIDARFAPKYHRLRNRFGDSVSVGARHVHCLCGTYHRLRKSFWTHTMEQLGDVGHVASCFSVYGDSANLDAR